MHNTFPVKRWFLFLIFLILLPVLPVHAASDDSEIYHGCWVHPFYRNQGFDFSEALSDDDVLLNASVTADRKDYSVDRCGETVREFLKAHTGSFTVYLFLDSSPATIPAFYGIEVFNASIQHTGVPDEGDYLENSLMYCSWDISVVEGDDYYRLAIHYQPVYVCSYEKEQAVSARFTSLYSELELDGKTDYQKALIIYDYLTQNIRYDYDALSSVNNKLGHSAYNALFKHTCVCQGFSLCFYRLMLMAGVDCRILRSSNHSWNLVNIHGVYYNADSTWGSIAIEEGKDPYIYFLASNALMKSYGNHVRIQPFSGSAFRSLYPTGSGHYKPTEADLGETEESAHPLVLTSLTRSSDNHLTLEWETYPGAVQYEIYRRCSSNDVWQYLDAVSAEVNTYTDRTSEVGETYYYTVKAVFENGSYSLFDNTGLHRRCTFTAEVTLLSAKPVSDTSVLLTWEKMNEANGYCIYTKAADSDQWLLNMTTGNVCSAEVSGLTAGHVYEFSIAPAKRYPGFTLRGSYPLQGLTACTFAVPSLNISAIGNGKVSAGWTSCPGVSGYQLCITQTGSSSKKYIKYSSSLNQTVLTLEKGKNYTFRIRTRKKYENTNYYGSWSPKVTVTI